jgi:hypothetical protein
MSKGEMPEKNINIEELSRVMGVGEGMASTSTKLLCRFRTTMSEIGYSEAELFEWILRD